VEKKQMKVPIYPNVPATGKTDTSVEAALSVDHKTWMNRVLSAVREKPSTMSEVALAYGVYPTTTRPRATQLTVLGFIRDSGQRRKNQFGRNRNLVTFSINGDF
jgi:hypothetical protein